MLNQAILVGRVKSLEENWLVLAVARNVKNEAGDYETDDINVHLEGKLRDNTYEYVEKGDIVGIKGSLRVEDGKMEVYAEKVSFLSSHARDTENED